MEALRQPRSHLAQLAPELGREGGCELTIHGGPPSPPHPQPHFLDLASSDFSPGGRSLRGRKEGAPALTQRKMSIYGQFLLNDVASGRAPFREPPPTLPGKGASDQLL